MGLPTFPKIYNVYFLACIVTMGGMLFGFDISSMSAIIGTDQYRDYFDNPSGVAQGAIGSALAAGSVAGSIIAGPILDKFGRRDSLMLACFWWLLGTAVQVALDASSMAYFVGYGCSFILGETASFRTAWGIQFVPCIFFMIGLPFLPRSPRWLAKVDRVDEAIHVLANIQADGNLEDPYVNAEYEEIITILTAERLAPRGWRKFINNGMWKRTLAGFSVQAWQQLSGANVMTYYVVYIFYMANLQGNVNLISSGVHLIPGDTCMGYGIAAIGNWLFNFAIGLFIPPAFLNIRWKLFIVFGVLCLGGAIQFYFTYPETCGKTIEGIEVLFSKDGPHAWKTKKGHSRLEHEVEAVANMQAKGEARASISEVVEKEKQGLAGTKSQTETV
ncbi:hypothetical protein K458DRAFT_426378 [Lentithecium fluviatile CBS 122367]|uniref:MFS general substrate transporter n=1 Tax=Lentithecium fluviatile CBS 122367 TaxID=1168545 RepID=A0A6G1JK94_9PLEO|nr:hypothetical protein K458DRAFT_426378 [Lentithecium fluviatile CBS 122367]